MNIYGGPLDGSTYDNKLPANAKYVILECSVDGDCDLKLYAMYRVRNGHFHFVSTKTKEEIDKIENKRKWSG